MTLPGLGLAERTLRAGWVARGVSYAGAGLLAASLTVGFLDRTAEPTQRGALGLVGSLPLGRVLLVLLGAGLLLYAAWELGRIAVGERQSLLDWIDHAGKLLGVCFYTVLAWSSWEGALGAATDSGSFVNRLSGTVMSYPLGRVAVGIAGIVVIGVAARRGRRVMSGEFDESLQPGRLDRWHRELTTALGRVGEVGRAIALTLVGGFLLVAAWYDRSTQARGLDRSLYAVSDHPAGRWAVLTIGLGFISYGLFCIVSAPGRQLR